MQYRNFQVFCSLCVHIKCVVRSYQDTLAVQVGRQYTLGPKFRGPTWPVRSKCQLSIGRSILGDRASLLPQW